MTPKQINLPELPEGFEWVLHAQADRVTVNLSYKVPDREPSESEGDDGEDKDVEYNGYVRSETRRHAVVIAREEWERQVVEAAHSLWMRYTEENRHAQWADELMRRSR